MERLETKSLPSRSPPITPNWRSPRLRHEIRKPRHSSADNLANEMTYITETEDVFYTYKGPLSPKDSDSEVSQNHSPHRESLSENNPAQSCLTQKSSSSVSPSSNAPGSCSPDGVDQRFLEDYHKVTKGGFVEDASQYYCDKVRDFRVLCTFARDLVTRSHREKNTLSPATAEGSGVNNPLTCLLE